MKPGIRHEEQFGWYEASLSPGERKKRGHFSTPHMLIDQILDACGYTSTADLRSIRVLDPACGSGNFLACVARRFYLVARSAGLDAEETRALIQRNLWGLDPDPVACCLAEMQVGAMVAALQGVDAPALRVHIHQADSLSLPWHPCVDLLVANPPYLATKNNDLNHYRLLPQRGQTDSYLLFLDLALKVVRPGGWIGLVLPDPVLARANAASARARLLGECTLHHIWHMANVFDAEVGAVVIIAQKLPPRLLHRISWTCTRWREEQPDQPQKPPVYPRQQVSQLLLVRQPDSALRYLLGSEQGRVFERLRRALGVAQQIPSNSRLRPLEQLVRIRRGEELGRDNAALGPLAARSDGYPVLRGGVDIRPYTRPTTDLGIARVAVSKPLERYLQPKLLVVKSTGRLQATLDTRGHVVLQTLYLLHAREADELLDTLYFLLALLNSHFLQTYVHHLYTAYKLVQPQIEQAVLARLPVPWDQPEARREIAARARELERICSEADPVVEWREQITTLYAEQERAICALYARYILTKTFNGEGVIPHV